jgi:hypothetical protein
LTLPAFHAVKAAKERLEKAGFKQIKVCAAWRGKNIASISSGELWKAPTRVDARSNLEEAA